jgi:hypothetical protein
MNSQLILKKLKMKTLFVIIFIIITSNFVASQHISKYGIKAGLIFTGMTTSNESSVFVDSAAFLNFLSFEAGIYAEIFNTRKFCLSAELHYSIKGERNPNFNTVLIPVTLSNGQYYEYKYLSDRFHYISFQLLPRYRLVITPSGENLYVLGGGKIDLLIHNTNSGDNKTVEINNFKLDFGVTTGLGIELMNFLNFEFRFEHSFRGPYKFSYGDKTVTRTFNSIIFFTGVSFNKL